LLNAHHFKQVDPKQVGSHLDADSHSAATRNLRLAAIRALMRYVERHVPWALAQVGRIDAIPVKRHDQKLVRHLTMDEVRSSTPKARR